jgi:hypothetical protein
MVAYHRLVGVVREHASRERQVAELPELVLQLLDRLRVAVEPLERVPQSPQRAAQRVPAFEARFIAIAVVAEVRVRAPDALLDAREPARGDIGVQRRQQQECGREPVPTRTLESADERTLGGVAARSQPGTERAIGVAAEQHVEVAYVARDASQPPEIVPQDPPTPESQPRVQSTRRHAYLMHPLDVVAESSDRDVVEQVLQPGSRRDHGRLGAPGQPGRPQAYAAEGCDGPGLAVDLTWAAARGSRTSSGPIGRVP